MLDRELADVYRLEGRFKEAGKYALNAIDALRTQGSFFDLAHSLRVLGMLRVYTGGLDEAKSRFEESIRLFEKMDPKKQRRYEWVWLWMGLGDVALGKGEFEKARQLYRDAEQKAQESEFELAVIHGCQADLFAAQREWDRAIELAVSSREVRNDHQDWFGVALTLDTEGRALCGKALCAQASERLREGAKLAIDCHSAYLESRLTLSLAGSQSQGGAAGFEAAARRARELATRNEYFDHLARLQVLLGERELRQGDFAASVRCFDAALGFARQFNRWFSDSILDEIVAASSASTAGDFTKYAALQSRRRITPAAQVGGD
jgi:tetratricopeptide (TPR) repeat protein